MQTKLGSLMESFGNVVFGYIISVAAGQFIYPMFDSEITLTDNMGITLAFTILSFGRSYVTRRFFNWLSIRRQVKARLQQQ